jgi:hypothetical protein
MFVINEQSFPCGLQRPVGVVEKIVCSDIVHRSEPFSFQYPPESFRNIQMRGEQGGKEKKEESSFLPKTTTC